MSGPVPIPAEYRDFAAVPFEIAFTDQFGHEDRSDGFSVIRKSRQDNTVAWRGTGLDGLDATQQPRVPSPSEESKRRYYELVAQENRSKRTDR
jgi:hypothetical protein